MMLQQIDKKNKLVFYIFIYLLLTTTLNINFNKKISINKIKTISLIGLNKDLENLLKKDLKKFEKNNIFFLNKKLFENELKKYSFIDTYTATKIYPNNIIVEIKSPHLLAEITKNNKKYYFGSNGKIIEKKYFKKSKELPNLFGKFNNIEFLNLVNLIKKTEFEYESIDNFYYYKSGRWDIEKKDKFIVKLPKENIKESLKIAKKILNKKNKNNFLIIDLRIANQIILNDGQ